MFNQDLFKCPVDVNKAKKKPNNSDDESDDESDDTFVFQDVYDMKDIPNRVGGEYNRNWGTYAIETDPWDDKKCPYVNILNKTDLKLNENEMKGILSIRMLAACSSYLSKSPITQQYVLCKCNLSRYGLKDINILIYYHHFEYIDLSYNNLTSVSALKNAAMLMYLDVSHNMLDELLDFRSPLNLTFVNYSYNCITQIKDLKQYWSIVHLDLSHNDIANVEGVENLKYLQVLDLSYNVIKSIKNIENLQNLIRLNLRNNKIFETECCLENLQQLRYIDLSYNKIKTLKMFRSHSLKIKQISMSHNLISNLLQLTHLQNLSNLVELDLSDNEIALHAMFWDVALNSLRCMKVLNNTYVAVTQKLFANNRFNPPVQIIFSKRKNMLLLLHSLRTSRMIHDCLLPANIPPPRLITLVGPLSCKKNEIATRFAEIEENVALFINHTTRPKLKNEIDGLHYYFISNKEFDKELRQGEFITVLENFGHMFGMHKRELEKANDYSNHVFITHTDLINALIMRDYGYMPTIVLAIPRSCEIHRQWIKEQYHHEYVNNYCAYLLEKQIHKILAEVALNTVSTLDDIVQSFCMVDEVIERASIKFDSVDNYFDLGLPEDTETPQENSSITDATEQHVSEKSCLRNKKAIKDICLTENVRAKRATVTFGNTEENLLSMENEEQDNVTKVMLGYDCAETFLVNVTREMQETVETQEDLQILEEILQKQQYENQDEIPVELKLKASIAKQYYNKFQRLTKEVEIYADSVIKMRNFYIDYHKENPGVFSNVIFTDEPEDKIMATLKEIANSRRKIKVFNDVHSYIKQEDSTRMINERKKEIARFLQCSQSTAICQQIEVDNYVDIQTKTYRLDKI